MIEKNSMRLVALLIIILGSNGLNLQNVRAANGQPAEQQAQEQVAAAFKLMEKSFRDGDGGLYFSLLDHKTRAAMDASTQDMYKKMPGQPWAKMDAVAIAIKGDQAFLIGTHENPQGHYKATYLIRYVREDGAWKIAEQTTSDAPPYPPAVYAYLPPDDGAFIRAGSPWAKFPYAELNTAFYKPSEIAWKRQTVQDENFLYIRLETSSQLPAPRKDISDADAQTITTGVAPIPSMVIDIAVMTDKRTLLKSSLGLLVGANIGSHATFDEAGKAKTQQHFLAYSLLLTNNRDERLFDGAPGDSTGLVNVHDHFIDLRIPLKGLGIEGQGEIIVRDYNSSPQLMPSKVVVFSP